MGTSIVTDAAGTVNSDTKYKAWGDVRYASGTNPTDYTYTGQYSHAADFGLMFYNARWYDPSLSRFASADSIVPAGVQGFNAISKAPQPRSKRMEISIPIASIPCAD